MNRLVRNRRVFGAAGVLVASAYLCFPPVHGQCIDYGDYLHWVARCFVPGSGGEALGLAVSGDHAYVAYASAGLQVMDVSDPGAPSPIGGVGTPGSAGCVAVSGNYAYVGCSVFQVVDVTNPAAPQLAGSVDTPRSPVGIVVEGIHAYVADGDSGLQIVDVSDPDAPVIVGRVAPPGRAVSVAVAGDHAYLAISTIVPQAGQLYVIDISDPASPVITGSVDMPSAYWAYGVAVSGNLVAVATGRTTGRLEVVDVSNPAAPTIIGEAEIPGVGNGVAISGGYAYITESVPEYPETSDTRGLDVFDLSDPSNPALVGSVNTPIGDTVAVVVSGNHVYLADRIFGIQILEAPSPASAPAFIGRHGFRYWASSVAVDGNYTFVGTSDGYAYEGAVEVLDTSNPSAPNKLGMLDMQRGVFGIAVSWPVVYATDRVGLQVVNVVSPSHPTTLGRVNTPGANAFGLALSGSYAYVASGASGLFIVDISNWNAPAIVGGVDLPGSAYEVAVSGDHAYVADWTEGLQVIDVSNPSAPFVVGSLDTPGGRARDVAVSGNYAYVADWFMGGLLVVDVSVPASPVIVGMVDTLGWARGVAISGDYAYVMDDTPGIQVVDISDPMSPAIVGGVATPGTAYAAVVSGDYVYVADRFPGLRILAAQCDEQPTAVALSGFSGEVLDGAVKLSWFTSFEHLHDGFHIYRSPLPATGYARLNTRLLRDRSPYSYTDSAIQPHSTYYYRLGAVDLRGKEVLYPPISVTTLAWSVPRMALGGGAPNPFARETTVHFSLPEKRETTLIIYDVAGRQVRALVGEELPAGDHEVSWDGHDHAGLRVSGGAYFVKLTAGADVAVQKLVYLGAE